MREVRRSLPRCLDAEVGGLACRGPGPVSQRFQVS
jgi:hypothetical protein